MKRKVFLPPTLACLLIGSLVLSGCGLIEGGASGDDGGGAADAKEPPKDGEFVQEGYVGKWQKYLRARVEITEVARLDDRTRTTIEFTSLEDEPVDVEENVFSSHSASADEISQFRIVDTVNQRKYGVYTDIGTDLPAKATWLPGVVYRLVVFSPPLQDGVEQVLVQAPGGIGEFAGVPVTDGEPQTYPSEPPETRPDEGDMLTFPVDTGEPEPLGEEYRDLVGAVRTVVQGRETENDQETVELRTDVLFDFDEAEITGNAAGILKDVIEETRERADPEKPPITIIGHTDGIGSDDYNQKLSEQRAEAVREVLEAELGSDYEYETEGKGSTEPLEPEGGDDDEEARAKNRRVEISYAFKEDIARETEGEEEGEEDLVRADPADVGPPGTFRSHADEEPVASTEGVAQPYTSGEDRTWSMDVYPFYRDGAYLVTRFAITHDGKEVAKTARPFNTGFGGFPFAVTDPETGNSYGGLVYDKEETRKSWRIGASPWPVATRAGDTTYGYYYVVAPPEDVTSVDFNAGPFGTFEDVPIQD